MTTISIEHRWLNNAGRGYVTRQSVPFMSGSSLYQSIDYARFTEGSPMPALLKQAKDISAAALSFGAFALNSSIVPSSAATRRQQVEALADQIQGFLASPYLDDCDATEAIMWAAKDALSFIQIIPLQIALPAVSYTDDGEIVMHWSQEGKRAEAAFPGHGKFGYAMREQGGFVAGNEEGSPSAFPRDLFAYLRQ